MILPTNRISAGSLCKPRASGDDPRVVEVLPAPGR